MTDGVANQGLVRPANVSQLVKNYDVRVFGFLLGNSGNWPLLRTLAAASNADDIAGQLILAKGKVTDEALHHAAVTFSGRARVFDTTGDTPQKIYRGQQLVIFGRYEGAGPTPVTLRASLTGEDKTYTTTVNFPETDTDNPEIERLWAMALIEQIEAKENAGLEPAAESHDAIQHLGVAYQLVTDDTSMIVLDDETHAKRGIARHNRQRSAAELAAQSVRATQPARQGRFDTAQPAFPAPAPHVSRHSGGGDLSGDAFTIGLVAVVLVLGAWFGRCHGNGKQE